LHNLTDQTNEAKFPIALFDSGVGGLSVLKELGKNLPNENVLYFADTLRIPYGSRKPEEIVRFNKEILQFLTSLGTKMVIMACGTSSAIAYPIVKDLYKIPIISLIEPGAKFAVAVTKNKKVGLIATSATVNSGAYERAIKKIDKDVKIFSNACPLFVPLIEGGFIETEETKNVAKEYLLPLIKEGIDTLILGCTHYPHLIKVLREITGVKVKFVNPAEEAVLQAKNILADKKILNPQKSNLSNYQFFVSGSKNKFYEIGSKFANLDPKNIKKVRILKSGKIEIED